MTVRILPLALALLLAAPAGAQQAAAEGRETPVQGSHTAEELALAGRLMAPCCWKQTLDVHTSGIAMELRREIRTRLAEGEAPEAIEADLVGRYGERLRAVPEDSPLGAVAATLLTLVGLAGLAVLFLGLRWRKRGRARAAEEPSEASSSETPAQDEWDERLDAELRDV